MADLVVAGAGMAGLCAAAEARARGADVLLLEKTPRPGGSMLLSSGVVWRHTEWRDFRAECPGGDEALQRLVWERLDEGLEWLESLGAVVVQRGTGNPRTTGVRFATAELTDALDRAAGGARCGAALESLPDDGTPVVLATGGFAANRELVRRWITPQADELLLRAAPGCTGDGLRMGLDAGGVVSTGLDEFYGRNMPAPPARVEPVDFVRLAQVYAQHATVTDLDGVAYTARTWSEIDVVQWTAGRRGARAFYRVEPAALAAPVRERTVAEVVAAAEAAGADVRHERDGAVVVPVRAGITTTLGGLRVTPDAQAAPGVWAAGADAGGIATGGYASGLAAALVLGRIAAVTALGDRPTQATILPEGHSVTSRKDHAGTLHP
jgi:succinate dehydrogenase/fumarate reductase flavoprotein subunit